jgi:FkbM family methyltransferase
LLVDFSSLDRGRLPGRVLRALLRLIPKEATLRVVQGPLRGQRWIAGAGTHGCWLGSYEAQKQREIARTLRPGAVVYDVGANVGFYTLLSARLVGRAGRVLAFEPLPRNLEYLNRHLALNDVRNVLVMPVAVGREGGTALFDAGRDPSEGRLSEDGGLEVTVVSLDEVGAQGEVPPPDLIKMDIEGAELEALRGATRLLTENRPILFLATHGREVHASCCRLLTDLGYNLRSLDGKGVEGADEIVASPS